jgi:hypothetical protein
MVVVRLLLLLIEAWKRRQPYFRMTIPASRDCGSPSRAFVLLSIAYSLSKRCRNMILLSVQWSQSNATFAGRTAGIGTYVFSRFNHPCLAEREGSGEWHPIPPGVTVYLPLHMKMPRWRSLYGCIKIRVTALEYVIGAKQLPVGTSERSNM